MAKKKEKVKEDVKVAKKELATEKLNVQQEETPKEAPKDDLRIVDTFIVKERTTTVIPMVDLNRVFIGGKYYNFKKGVDQKVPLDVERVLRERDLIK
jgi:hypothetical protein